MNVYDGIAEIMEQYPESKWISKAKEQFPDSSEFAIISIIEALQGGDVVEIEED